MGVFGLGQPQQYWQNFVKHDTNSDGKLDEQEQKSLTPEEKQQVLDSKIKTEDGIDAWEWMNATGNKPNIEQKDISGLLGQIRFPSLGTLSDLDETPKLNSEDFISQQIQKEMMSTFTDNFFAEEDPLGRLLNQYEPSLKVSGITNPLDFLQKILNMVPCKKSAVEAFLINLPTIKNIGYDTPNKMLAFFSSIQDCKYPAALFNNLEKIVSYNITNLSSLKALANSFSLPRIDSPTYFSDDIFFTARLDVLKDLDLLSLNMSGEIYQVMENESSIEDFANAIRQIKNFCNTYTYADGSKPQLKEILDVFINNSVQNRVSLKDQVAYLEASKNSRFEDIDTIFSGGPIDAVRTANNIYELLVGNSSGNKENVNAYIIRNILLQKKEQYSLEYTQSDKYQELKNKLSAIDEVKQTHIVEFIDDIINSTEFFVMLDFCKTGFEMDKNNIQKLMDSILQIIIETPDELLYNNYDVGHISKIIDEFEKNKGVALEKYIFDTTINNITSVRPAEILDELEKIGSIATAQIDTPEYKKLHDAADAVIQAAREIEALRLSGNTQDIDSAIQKFNRSNTEYEKAKIGYLESCNPASIKDADIAISMERDVDQARTRAAATIDELQVKGVISAATSLEFKDNLRDTKEKGAYVLYQFIERNNLSIDDLSEDNKKFFKEYILPAAQKYEQQQITEHKKTVITETPSTKPTETVTLEKTTKLNIKDALALKTIAKLLQKELEQKNLAERKKAEEKEVNLQTQATKALNLNAAQLGLLKKYGITEGDPAVMLAQINKLLRA